MGGNGEEIILKVVLDGLELKKKNAYFNIEAYCREISRNQK